MYYSLFLIRSLAVKDSFMTPKNFFPTSVAVFVLRGGHLSALVLSSL